MYYSPAFAEELTTGDISVAAMDNNTSDKTLHTGKGNVTIGKISNVKNGDVDQGVDSLDIIAKAAGEEGNGNINIGTSAAAITNATMTADGNITFGETSGASEVLEVRGLDNDERDVSIKAKGDIVFNQAVEIHPGEGAHPSGDVEIYADGEMHFLGEKTTIQNGGTGNPATTTIEVGGIVEFRNVNGTEIGRGVKFKTTEAGSDISITTNGLARANIIAGTVDSAGAVSVFGSTNQILEQSGKARIHAADGILVTASKQNSTQNAELTSQNGPLTLKVQVSDGDKGYNMIYSSLLEVVGQGNVEISGGDAHLQSASVAARRDDVSISGGHVFVGRSFSDTSASTLDAAGKIDVAGDTVSIQDSTSIDSVDGNVSITASGSDTAAASSTTPALSVTGGNVSSRSGDVKIAAENGTAALADVEVKGKSARITGDKVVVSGKSVTGAQSVEIAGTASTTISNVEVSGSGTASLGTSTGVTEISDSGVAVDGQVDINGSGVSITGNEGIDAGQGGVAVAAAAGEASITGGSVKGDGSVAVSATGEAKLTDVEVSGSSASVTGDKVEVSGKSVTGAQSVEIAGVNGTSVDGVDVDGKTIDVGTGGATIIKNSTTLDATENIAVNGSSVEVKESHVGSTSGNVTISGTTAARVIDSDVSGDSVNLNGGTTAANTIEGADTLVDSATNVDIDGSVNTVQDGADVAAGKEVTIEAATNNVVQGGATVTAGTGIGITANGTAPNSGNLISDATLTATGDIKVTAAGENEIASGAELTATSGNVTMTGENNTITEASMVDAGMNVIMTAATQNTVADSTVTADNGSITMGGKAGSTETVQNEVTAAAGKSTTLTAEQDVTITGENSITGSASGDVDILTRNGDISIHGDNEIQRAGITAAGGVSISTGTGDKATRVADADISGKTVTIAGDIADDRSAANLAVVTGEETMITSRGEDAGAGITLNNVSVVDTAKGAANIKAANGGHIAILNRVDVFNGTLTIQSSDSYDSGAGRIVVDGSNVLNMKADSSLEGRLSGAGSINKSGGDELLLDRDHRDFSGTIYANGAEGDPEGSVADADNAGSWIQVTAAGVGEDARMVLKNTDLVIETWETQIGSLDTTQDAGANNTATGGTLGADASYTADGNTRADFKTIGSVVEVNKGVSGDVVHAANLALSDATLLKLDATVDAGGNATSDIIAATGTVDVAARTGLNSTSTAAAPSTARVYINHTDMTAASQVAEGTRTPIMSGTMAGDINADVLYDVEKSANGTYQRILQDRNVHLENKGDRVDLVFSKNYRSAAKTASMQKVAEAIRQYSDAFHHSEGWLASSDDQMAKLVDAFDYTRSEAAAQRGLQSLAGMGNVLPQLMLFDASRHHLNQLRKQMEMPVCPRTWKGAPTRKSNAWLAYTGAYDSLNGDANMGDYTRSAHGAMMGVDAALTCKLRAGLSLGYETASGEADSAKVDADSIFVDAYATAYTGHIKHRASIGLALTSFDSRRGVEVEAGYHSFHGTARSDTDALTLNIGYEISSDYKLSERSWLTRFASLNLSWHNLDGMKESSLGEIGLVSEYDSEWQAGVAVGLAYNREFAAVKYEAPAVFSAHAAVHFELLADKATATNRFSVADGGWETHSMDREQLYFELGAGVMVPLSPAWTASAGAAVEVGADRSAFSGNVGVRYAF